MTIFFAHSLILIRQFKGLPLVLRDAVLDTIIARICGICNPFCTIHRLGDSYIRISAALVVRLVPHCHGTVNLACPDAQLLANPFKRAADRLCNLCVMLRDLPRRLHVREKHTHRVIGNDFVGCRLLAKAKVSHILGDQVKPDLASLFASLLQDKCLKRLVLLRRLLLQNVRQLMPEDDARRRVAAAVSTECAKRPARNHKKTECRSIPFFLSIRFSPRPA